MMIEINGEPKKLKATWDASTDYDDLIGSPINHAYQMMRGDYPLKAKETALAIWIGIKHGGDPDIKLADVQQACFKLGLTAASSIASSFIMAINTGGEDVEVKVEEGGEKKPSA